MPDPKLNFIFINGRIAAGKDAAAKSLLEAVPGAIILSTGDIYRGAKFETGEFAKFHNRIVPYLDLIDNRGGLLPDGVMCEIVREVILEKTAFGFSTFIFTGFPRTIPQLDETRKMLSSFNTGFEVESTFACIAVLDRHSRERTIKRVGETIARGETPRPEDSPDNVEKRLKTYKALTEPMLHRLTREQDLLIIKGSEDLERFLARVTESFNITNGTSPERR